jgi:hypothetical protein
VGVSVAVGVLVGGIGVSVLVGGGGVFVGVGLGEFSSTVSDGVTATSPSDGVAHPAIKKITKKLKVITASFFVEYRIMIILL